MSGQPDAAGGIYAAQLADIDRCISIGRRSAILVVQGDDEKTYVIHLHDPHWRAALFGFRHEVQELIVRESALRGAQKEY